MYPIFHIINKNYSSYSFTVSTASEYDDKGAHTSQLHTVNI